mgnify:FL=1
MSAKRRALLPERAAVKQAAHERDAWRCQFWTFYDRAGDNPHEAVPIACSQGLEAHEVIPRSAWTAGWLELSNIVSLCPRHHAWVGDHPNAAEAIGLHARSWDRPK